MESLAVAVLALALSPPDRDPAALVRRLGDRSFQVREDATRRLRQLGRPAFDALQAGLGDASPEVRNRCRQLLPAILDQEMRARLDAFQSDSNSDDGHGVPGWGRFRRLVGDAPGRRELFARIARADLRLLDTVENHPAAGGAERLAGRCAEIQQRLRSHDPSVRTSLQAGDVAQLLFLGSHPDVALPPAALAQLTSLTYQPVFRAAILSGDQAAALLRLVAAWVDRHADDPSTCNMVTSLLSAGPLPGLVDAALRLAANRKLMGYARAQTLVALGRVGPKDFVPKLEALLGDDALVSNFVWNNVRGQTQVRDVALAMAIHLSGQKPADYGFEALKSNPNFIQSYYYLGFASDAARTAARLKWLAWKADAAKAGPQPSNSR